MVDKPQEVPHFDIDATVVKRLGEELISDEVSAIMELVKNSYDADADWIKITINTDGKVPVGKAYVGVTGYITLEDNGQGMSYDEIISKWLVISLSSKREMKARNETTAKGRVPLGDKGVGRLSTQRLGRQLELISGVIGSDEMHHIAFDWADFDSHIPLSKINLQHTVSSKKPKQKGTQLIISHLVNASIWKKEAADKFRGQLSQLIFPYKSNRPFSVYLTINGQQHDLDEISEELQTQAIGRYKFRFEDGTLVLDGQIRLSKLRGQFKREEFEALALFDQGQEFFRFLTNRNTNPKNFLNDVSYGEGWFLSFNRKYSFEKDFPRKSYATITSLEDGEMTVLADPGSFYGEIDEYDLRGTDSTEAVFSGLKEYKNLVSNQVGIRVFRDGFGIKPYGFDGYDWLNLGGGQTSGGSFYGLRPNNVIGFVSITMAGNAQLKELTSREGFTDSPYSRNFELLMRRVTKEISELLERTRRSFLDYRKEIAQKNTGFNSIAEPATLLIETSRQAQALNSRSQAAQRQFNNLSTSVKKQVNKLKNEPLFQGPGEVSALPLLQEVDTLVTEGAKLFSEINQILDKAKQWEDTAKYISTKVTDLEGQLVQFTELAGLGLTAEALTHDMYVLLDRINASTDAFNKQLGKSAVPTSVYEFMEYVRSFTRDLRKQLTHLSPSLRFNREKREMFSLSEFVQSLREYYLSRFATDNIDFIINTQQDFTVVANKGKLTQIFDNLILNSEYWLRERKRNELQFMPIIKIDINEPFVRVSDNGFGIAETLENTLFQPFITSKPAEVGRGLGLFIVEQLLESLGGDIYLLPMRNEFNRRYIFQLSLEGIIKT